MFDATLTAFYRRVIRAIRAADRRKLIWYEPNVLFNFGSDPNLGPIGDPHAGFAFHDYCVSEGVLKGRVRRCYVELRRRVGEAPVSDGSD